MQQKEQLKEQKADGWRREHKNSKFVYSLQFYVSVLINNKPVKPL